MPSVLDYEIATGRRNTAAPALAAGLTQPPIGAGGWELAGFAERQSVATGRQGSFDGGAALSSLANGFVGLLAAGANAYAASRVSASRQLIDNEPEEVIVLPTTNVTAERNPGPNWGLIAVGAGVAVAALLVVVVVAKK